MLTSSHILIRRQDLFAAWKCVLLKVAGKNGKLQRWVKRLDQFLQKVLFVYIHIYIYMFFPLRNTTSNKIEVPPSNRKTVTVPFQEDYIFRIRIWDSQPKLSCALGGTGDVRPLDPKIVVRPKTRQNADDVGMQTHCFLWGEFQKTKLRNEFFPKSGVLRRGMDMCFLNMIILTTRKMFFEFRGDPGNC